jgi:hypothetical protein
MKSIPGILGIYQRLFGRSYDIQEIFEGSVTGEHRTCIHLLRVIEEFLPIYVRPSRMVGRKAYDHTAMIHSCLAKQFFWIFTVSSLCNRLLRELALWQICGFSPIPSEATCSKRYAYYVQEKLMEQTLGP